MDMSQYRELFISESREHLRSMSELIVSLEKGDNDGAKIDALFRDAHSIKGMAASMGYQAIAELAHKIEDLMDRVRKGVVAFGAAVADLLFEGTDVLETMVADVEQSGSGHRDITGLARKIGGYNPAEATESVSSPLPPRTEPPPFSGTTDIPAKPQKQVESRQTVRVKTEILDHLINTTGELITNKHRLMNVGREIGSRKLEDALAELSRLLRELYSEVINVRMMPFTAIIDRFPRVVRDLAKNSGKEVTFEIEGAEIELDRGILEELSDPLIHILRNAVDHGLETAAERLASGKPAKGVIRLSVRREKDQVVIVAEDDGRGMDPEQLTASAIEKGLVTPEKGKMLSPRDALMLTCLPGFTTAREVTDVSGRGVGMDAVRSTIQALAGTLAIESEPGRGSKIILKLPLTITIINVLLAEISGISVAIPVTTILRTMELRPSLICDLGEQQVFYLDGEAVPIVSLHRVFGIPPALSDREFVPLFVTEIKGRRAGMAVDRFLGQQEVFVKPLGRPLAKLNGLAGGAILGDGEVVFILDIANLQ